MAPFPGGQMTLGLGNSIQLFAGGYCFNGPSRLLLRVWTKTSGRRFRLTDCIRQGKGMHILLSLDQYYEYKHQYASRVMNLCHPNLESSLKSI
jgi:hypothetical protein